MNRLLTAALMTFIFAGVTLAASTFVNILITVTGGQLLTDTASVDLLTDSGINMLANSGINLLVDSGTAMLIAQPDLLIAP